MFDFEKIKKLNNLEMGAYDYIIKNLEKIPFLTIRELSEHTHVSTTTLLRMCTKLGFDGYSELKYEIKQELKKHKQIGSYFYDATVQIDSFLKKINHKDYRLTVDPAVELIEHAEQILFIGAGTSGTLGEYGSRYFLNLGLNAHSVLDPFAPAPKKGMGNKALVIALSVSGETKQTIRQAEWYKEEGARILALTNDQYSTLATLSTHNVSYHMPEQRSQLKDTVNLTTQVPVIAILETLAHHAHQKVFVRGNAAYESEKPT